MIFEPIIKGFLRKQNSQTSITVINKNSGIKHKYNIELQYTLRNTKPYKKLYTVKTINNQAFKNSGVFKHKEGNVL